MRRLIAIPLMFGPCAHAEQPDVDLTSMSFEDLGKLDVSATSLLPATWLSTASTVTVRSPRDWERSGARRTYDALGDIPGVFVMPHTNGNAMLAIRGYARLTSFTGAAVMLDGVPLTDLYRSSPQYSMPAINLGVLSQMQLIQGPGSALYGSDAFHGVLALRTHGADETGTEGSATLGNGGYYEAALRNTQPLGPDGHWSMAFAANGQGDQHMSATRPNPAGGAPIVVERDNSFMAQTAVVKASLARLGGWTWQGGLYLHRYGSDNFQGLGSRLAGAQDLGGVDTRFAMLQAGGTRQLGEDASLEVKAYGWWIDNSLANRLQSGGTTVQRDLASRQDRIGLQAIYRDNLPAWRTGWALALGAERLNVRDVHTTVHSLAGAFISTTPNLSSGSVRDVRSATLEFNSRLAQSWRAVYGARLDDYSDFGRHTSPRAGLIYQPAEASAIKLLYGQAFRAPSAAERNGNINTVLGNSNLKPETIDTTELVAQHQQGNALWQGSLFRSSWKEGIAIVFRQDLRINQFQNVESNRAHGASGDFTLREGPWQFGLGGAWVSSRNAVSGAHYNIFPRTSATASLARSVADGAGQISIAQRWMAGFDDIPSGDIFKPTHLPRYARTDVTYSHQYSKQLALTFVVRNLFNRDNRQPSPLGSVGGIPDERINATLRASYRF
ncbi:TonB-dependent receptor plug domain-containing protein [Pseudoduganella rivuli]|nr:TonB-dependent receptor [Pseudoduganella rivuli]